MTAELPVLEVNFNSKMSSPTTDQLKESLVRNLSFKLKQCIKTKTRWRSRSRSPVAEKPKHILRASARLDARYEDVRKRDGHEFTGVIKPRISLLSLDCIAFKMCVIAIKLSMLLTYVGGIFVGKFVGYSLSKIWYSTSSFEVSCGLFRFMLSAVGILALMILINYLKFLETAFSAGSVTRIRNPVLNGQLKGMSNDDMKEMFNRLPWRLRELGVDSFSWGNEIIELLWPNFARFVYAKVKKIIDKESSIKNVIKFWKIRGHLFVDRLTLGTQAPRVEGIRVLNANASRYDDLVIQTELDLDMDGEVSARLDIGFRPLSPSSDPIDTNSDEIAFMPKSETNNWSSKLNCLCNRTFLLPMGLKKLRLRVKTEIVTSPLLSRLPGVGGVTVRLLEPPLIDWSFSGWLIFLNPLGYLASQLLYFLAKSPHPIHADFTELFPELDLDQMESKAVLQVNLYCARDIPHPNALLRLTPDSFVLVEVESISQWTKIVRSSSNPVFNQTFTFLLKDIHSRHNPIRVALYDEDTDQDVELGHLVVPLNLVRSSIFNGRRQTLPLLDPETAERLGKGTTGLEIRLTLVLLFSEPMPRPSVASVSEAVLTVFIDSARGLNNFPTNFARSPELRILVRAQLGHYSQVTRIRERTAYPVWKECLVFPLEKPELTEILIEVIDVYELMEKRSLRYLGRKTKDTFADWRSLAEKGVKLGSVILRPPHVHRNRKEKLLDGLLEKAYLTLATDVKYCGWDDNISQNWNLPTTDLSLEFLKTHTT